MTYGRQTERNENSMFLQLVLETLMMHQRIVLVGIMSIVGGLALKMSET